MRSYCRFLALTLMLAAHGAMAQIQSSGICEQPGGSANWIAAHIDDKGIPFINGNSYGWADTTGTALNSISLHVGKGSSGKAAQGVSDFVVVVSPTKPTLASTDVIFMSRNTGVANLGSVAGTPWSSDPPISVPIGVQPGLPTADLASGQFITFSPPLPLTGQKIWVGNLSSRSDFWNECIVLTFTPANAEQLVARLYVALFGRAPDTEGLAYWASRVKAGATLAGLADIMYGVAPARAYYPSGAAARDVVGSFYRNVLGRVADAGGLDYWSAKLSVAGATPGGVIAEMINVVVNYTGSDAAGLKSALFFGNRVSAAMYYAARYGVASTEATQVITNVTDSAATLTAAKARVDVLSGK